MEFIEFLFYFFKWNSSVFNWAPLHFAAFTNDEYACKQLVRCDAFVNIKGRSGETPLQIAAIKSSYDAALQLIHDGADPMIETDDGKSALQTAIDVNCYEIVALFMRNGANPLGISYSHCENPQKMRDLVEFGFKNDEWDEEKAIIYKKGCYNEILPYDYPETPEINPETRYTDQEYIKELKEKMKKQKKISDSDE